MLERTFRSFLACSLTGLGLAAAAAALDLALSLTVLSAVVLPGQAWTLALWYVGLGSVGCGLLGGAVSLFGERPATWARGACLYLALVLVLAATANVLWLPRATGPAALAVDLGIAVSVLVLLLVARRRGARAPGKVFALIAVAGVALLAAGIGLSSAGAGLPEPVEITEAHPPVLCIVVDTLRADHTGIGGYERNTSPHLDRFAGDALRFSQARSVAPWTLPSVGTLQTGLPPGMHGVERKQVRLPDSAVTVAETLQASGYATGFFSDNPLVVEAMGMAQGFDHVLDHSVGLDLSRLGIPVRSLLGRTFTTVLKRTSLHRGYRYGQLGAGKLGADFLAWLSGVPADRPWFAYVHYMEPHSPYSPPEEFLRRFTDRATTLPDMNALEKGVAPFEAGKELPDELRQAIIDAYDGEISYWDDCFAGLLRELDRRGRLSDTVVLVTADHGEAFYEHEFWFHSNGLHDEVLLVPLVLRVPDGPRGVCRSRVSIAGVAETLVRTAGFEPPQSMQTAKQALLPVPAADRSCHASTIWEGAEELSLVRDGRKWIYAVREGETKLQCFDLDEDPGENEDLVEERGGEGERIRDEMLRRRAAHLKQALKGGQMEHSTELDELLRGLGYLK